MVTDSKGNVSQASAMSPRNDEAAEHADRTPSIA